MALVVIALFKPEKHFFLSNFGEIELFLIKGLNDLVHPELSWSLLEMTPLIQLSNKTILARNDLCLTTGYIIAKKALAHSVLPLTQQQIVQETYLRLLLR